MMNNLDIKTLNIQELDSREMTTHNGGGFGDTCLGEAPCRIWCYVPLVQ